MKLSRITALRAMATAPALTVGSVLAKSIAPVRIRVLTDMQSGFSAWSGKCSVIAAQMATTSTGMRVGPQVVAKMEELRADGRHLHDMYVMEVKRPEESRPPCDYFKLVQKFPAQKAFRHASAKERSLSSASSNSLTEFLLNRI